MPALTRAIASAAAVLATATLGASTRTPNPEVFPGAVLDRVETAALSAGGAVVHKTGADFGVVLNYYRFKRKQAVHVVEENLGDRFGNIASAFERRDPPPALLLEPAVQRFHQSRFGRNDVPAARAAAAWREMARRHAGRVQRIGEGERVTLYRPYLSQRTFELIDATVIVLRTPGGRTNARATRTSGEDVPAVGIPGRTRTRADR